MWFTSNEMSISVYLSGLFCGIYLLFLQWGGNKALAKALRKIKINKSNFLFSLPPLFSGAGRGEEGVVKT